MQMNDCPCPALFTNLDCEKHARPYLLSFHRALPGSLIRLEILAAAFKHEDFNGHWPNWLYIRLAQWDEFLADQTELQEFTFDNATLTPSYLGMQVEFIPYGKLRVGDRRYV